MTYAQQNKPHQTRMHFFGIYYPGTSLLVLDQHWDWDVFKKYTRIKAGVELLMRAFISTTVSLKLGTDTFHIALWV